MALNLRQRLCYRHTCDVWRASRNANTDGIGTPGAEQYTRIATGVRYHHQTTENIDESTVIGRLLQPSLLTTDHAHFDAAQNLRDGDIIIGTLVGDPMFGQFFRLLGPGRGIGNHGRRRANKQSYDLRLLERPPSAIAGAGVLGLNFTVPVDTQYLGVI